MCFGLLQAKKMMKNTCPNPRGEYLCQRVHYAWLYHAIAWFSNAFLCIFLRLRDLPGRVDRRATKSDVERHPENRTFRKLCYFGALQNPVAVFDSRRLHPSLKASALSYTPSFTLRRTGSLQALVPQRRRETRPLLLDRCPRHHAACIAHPCRFHF